MRLNYEKARAMVKSLLDTVPNRYIDSRIKEDVITDIIDCAEVDNLDPKTIERIISKWNEKVK